MDRDVLSMQPLRAPYKSHVCGQQTDCKNQRRLRLQVLYLTFVSASNKITYRNVNRLQIVKSAQTGSVEIFLACVGPCSLAFRQQPADYCLNGKKMSLDECSSQQADRFPLTSVASSVVRSKTDVASFRR